MSEPSYKQMYDDIINIIAKVRFEPVSKLRYAKDSELDLHALIQ